MVTSDDGFTIEDVLVGLDICSAIEVTRIGDDPKNWRYTWVDETTPYCAVTADMEPHIGELPWRLKRITSLGDSLFGEVIVYRRLEAAK